MGAQSPLPQCPVHRLLSPPSNPRSVFHLLLLHFTRTLLCPQVPAHRHLASFTNFFWGEGEGQGAFLQHLGRLPRWYPCLLPVSATLRTCPQPTSLFATETAPADITRGRPVAGRSGHLRPLRGHPGRSAVSLPGDSRPLSHSTCVLEASHVVPSQPDLFSRPLLLPSY